MIAKINIDGIDFSVNLDKPQSIAIPLQFNGEQPNTYSVPKAKSKAYSDQNFVGDVRQGGSCNFEALELIPHCNGTHTECIGHITKERVHIAETNFKRISIALLISLEPILASQTDESYNHTKLDTDKIISKQQLERAINNYKNIAFDSLIIRTLPNSTSKLSDDYADIPAYFSTEAVQYIYSLGVSNLLVDLPSIDRLFDAGLMNNHRTFWQVNEAREINDGTAHKTVTEFIFVADNIADGNYLLEIQIPPFLSDAAPSTPLLYNLEKE